MATYQYVISLVPRMWVVNENNTINILYDGQGYDTSIAWKNSSQPSNLRQLHEKILPIGKSWNKDLYVWGDSEHSDISVWYESNNVIDITIRIDLRENFLGLLIKCINLAKELDCMLLIPESKIIISSDVNELCKLMLKSNAMKFVSDPVDFLNSIKNNY